MRAVGIQLLQVGGVAEVGQQQETLGRVLRQHLRHRDAGGGEQLRHVNERPHVFLRRRRVHHDQRAAGGAIEAEIAAEAGIGRGWSQRVGQQRGEFRACVQRGEPLPELRQARVGGGRRGGRSGSGRRHGRPGNDDNNEGAGKPVAADSSHIIRDSSRKIARHGCQSPVFMTRFRPISALQHLLCASAAVAPRRRSVAGQRRRSRGARQRSGCADHGARRGTDRAPGSRSQCPPRRRNRARRHHHQRRLRHLPHRRRRSRGQRRRAHAALWRPLHRRRGEAEPGVGPGLCAASDLPVAEKQCAWRRRAHRFRIERSGRRHGRHLQHLRRPGSGLVSENRHHAPRSGARSRHLAQDDRLFQGGADPGHAGDVVSAVGCAQVGRAAAHLRHHQHRRFRSDGAVLLQYRAESRPDAVSEAHRAARAATGRQCALSGQRLFRHHHRRSAAQRPGDEYHPLFDFIDPYPGLCLRGGFELEPERRLRRQLSERFCQLADRQHPAPAAARRESDLWRRLLERDRAGVELPGAARPAEPDRAPV